ncbi:MAG: hypothetical protein QOC87_1157 [Actinomycetota bacterium]|jgi:hypothetical protein|nr:hypothetical protein [Actinomycetota bacterium]
MPKTPEILYAVVGAGEFAVEKARNASKITDISSTTKVYNDFVKRGKSLSKRVKNAGPTRQAVAQSKTARTRVKGAWTSVGKAVQANAKGSRTAAAQTKKARSQVKGAATSVKKAADAGAKATKAAASKVASAS